MKAFAKYFTLTLVLAVMLHYTVEKSALAGCQHGVFFMLNDMFGERCGTFFCTSACGVSLFQLTGANNSGLDIFVRARSVGSKRVVNVKGSTAEFLSRRIIITSNQEPEASNRDFVVAHTLTRWTIA